VGRAVGRVSLHRPPFPLRALRSKRAQRSRRGRSAVPRATPRAASRSACDGIECVVLRVASGEWQVASLSMSLSVTFRVPSGVCTRTLIELARRKQECAGGLQRRVHPHLDLLLHRPYFLARQHAPYAPLQSLRRSNSVCLLLDVSEPFPTKVATAAALNICSVLNALPLSTDVQPSLTSAP
jgi:hypothetical protein